MTQKRTFVQNPPDEKIICLQDQPPWKEHYETANSRASTILDRDPNVEKAIWNTHVAPIVNKKPNLKRKDGGPFEYRYFEKQLTWPDIDAMIRKTSRICMSIKFPRALVSTEETDDPFGGAINFSEEVVRRLRDCGKGEQRFELKAGGDVDLRQEFRIFLDDIFENQTLPDFLEMLAADGFEPGAIGKEIELARAASEELLRLHKNLKNKIGFRESVPDRESRFKEATRECFQENRSTFRYVKAEHLDDNDLYIFRPGQEKGDFIGKLLVKIFRDNGIECGWQRAYQTYKTATKTD